ncbi:MarR family winged helix-turn-helix transcriptional regulator [Hyphobacterium sp.]|uniref:MarR family winged helix-turn-helix transcriptional regulator n=1 Tax=Hyphobacterium sp. TaxID=2004662 RepID=UPI00374A2618
MSMNSRSETALDDYAPAFLGMIMSRLVDEIVAAGSETARALSIDLPPRSMSIITLLAERERSVTEIALAVGQTHAGVIKNMKPLAESGLVTRFDDNSDGRRKPYGLTPKGRNIAGELDHLLKAGAAAYRELFEEIGIDLYDAVLRADAALKRQSMSQRMLAKAMPAKR